jgi:hypothetical protein
MYSCKRISTFQIKFSAFIFRFSMKGLDVVKLHRKDERWLRSPKRCIEMAAKSVLLEVMKFGAWTRSSLEWLRLSSTQTTWIGKMTSLWESEQGCISIPPSQSSDMCSCVYPDHLPNITWLHLPLLTLTLKMEATCYSKMSIMPATVHSIRTLENTIWIFTAMKTSNLINVSFIVWNIS